MTSILFLIERIYCNIFRCNYLRNWKIFLILFSIFEISNKFLTFFLKKVTLIAYEIFNLSVKKKWLDKCLKSPVLEDPSTSNMVNGPRHCWNLNGSTFTIFIGQCEGNSVAKTFSWWYQNYLDYFLTHWLPMTSILFLREAIYCNIFWCNYLRKRKLFLNFFLHFRNLGSVLYILKKKMTLIADVFLNLWTPKKGVS